MNEIPIFKRSGRVWEKGEDAPWASVRPKSPKKSLGYTSKLDVNDGSVPAVPLVDIEVDIKPAENP